MSSITFIEPWPEEDRCDYDDRFINYEDYEEFWEDELEHMHPDVRAGYDAMDDL